MCTRDRWLRKASITGYGWVTCRCSLRRSRGTSCGAAPRQGLGNGRSWLCAWPGCKARLDRADVSRRPRSQGSRAGAGSEPRDTNPCVAPVTPDATPTGYGRPTPPGSCASPYTHNRSTRHRYRMNHGSRMRRRVGDRRRKEQEPSSLLITVNMAATLFFIIEH